MTLKVFIENIKTLTFSKVIKGILFAWLISIPFAPFLYSLMPKMFSDLYQIENLWIQWGLWIGNIILSMIFLKGIIGKEDKKNALEIGCMFGVFIVMLNLINTPWVYVSYGYILLSSLVTFLTLSALGYILGEK